MMIIWIGHPPVPKYFVFWSIKNGCWNDIYNIDYKYICKDSKNKGPSSLRSVVSCHPNQAQTIEFVDRGRIKSRCNSKLSPSLRPWSLSNRLLWMKRQLGIKSTLGKPEGQLFVLNIVQVYIKIVLILFYALRAFSRFIIPLSSRGSLLFCPIRTLLKVIERVANCGVTV